MKCVIWSKATLVPTPLAQVCGVCTCFLSFTHAHTLKKYQSAMSPTTINSFLSIDKMWWGTTLANKHLKSCTDHECLHDCPNNNLQLGTEWEFVVAVPQDHLNSPCLLYIFCGLCLFFKHCEYSELIRCEYQPIAFSRLDIIWTYILPNLISSVFICAAGCLHWHRWRRL